MKCTLLFGGTFDPIHYGHICSAKALLEKFDESSLVMVPCRIPPHRPQPMASAGDRLQMLKLAVAEESGLEVDDCELKRQGPTYTFDTLSAYRKKTGCESPLYFVLGHDAWVTLPTWYRWVELVDLAHLIVLGRPGQFADEPEELKNWVQDRRVTLEDSQSEPCGKVVGINLAPIHISATAARRALACGRPVDDMVPKPVERYIVERQLYVTEH